MGVWEGNREKILEIAGNGLVLDVGGWADPFPRADYVIDICPYETRALGYHGVGKLPTSVLYDKPRPGERFTKDTWIIHDICGPNPFPFEDKMFDFVICSHTLEDVRDPIKVCSEIVRVGKAGYVEVPSVLWEMTLHLWEGIVGEYHHRWLVEISGSHLKFIMKPHFLHTSSKCYVSQRFVSRRPLADRISYLFWEDSFTFQEVMFCQRSYFERFVEGLNIPQWCYWMDRAFLLRRNLSEIIGKVRSVVTGQRSTPEEDLWTWEKLFEYNVKLLNEDSSDGISQ